MRDALSFKQKNTKIAIIGLGYVGLPLAVEFGKIFQTIGFDLNKNRIKQLLDGNDVTKETTSQELSESKQLILSDNVQDIESCNIFIVTVPTPIDEFKQPDLSPLQSASKMIASCLKLNDIVIYESTVYPGVTEEVCVPILEEISGYTFNKEFFAGYSPERINPGDKERPLTKIMKVTSGSTPEVADFVDDLYKSIITAGTFKASTIKVAEASKVIENVQRDVNIALVNELHQIFDKLQINTREVIEAASTKWNFMKLMPGLVGGHCIGVDPYYLLHKAEKTGYIPDLMRQAREINNAMPTFIANTFVTNLIKKKINPVGCKILILGFTFKENCPDLRNTKVFDLYKELENHGLEVSIYDPWVDNKIIEKEYGISVLTKLPSGYDVGILAVGHTLILDSIKDKAFSFNQDYIYDFKGLLS